MARTKPTSDPLPNEAASTPLQEALPPDSETEALLIGIERAPNWSAKIRFLASQGFKKSTIAHILSEMRGYPLSVQHVNNVLSRPLKSGEGGRGPGRPREEIDPRAVRIIRYMPQLRKSTPPKAEEE